MAMAFGKVYTFGPTFRAERSYTQRHAAEFWMIEPEMAFTDLNGNMDVIEAAIKYVIQYVMDTCPQDMAFCNQFVDKGLIDRLQHVLSSDFVRVSYTDAVAILEQHNDEFEYKVSWGCDLQTEHEKFLTEKHFGKPVFVTDYPKEIKAFYMRLNDDGKTVAAEDLLVPGIGELVGGSQREERYDVLVRRIHELGPQRGGLLVVSGPAPLWREHPLRVRYRLRAAGDVPDGHLQHPGRAALPPHHRRAVLIAPPPLTLASLHQKRERAARFPGGSFLFWEA